MFFPTRKIVKGIDGLQRVALSVGFSIALVPLIGFILNYTPWGIRLESISFALSFFVICLGIFGLHRWFRTSPQDRFILSFDLSFLASGKKPEKVLLTLIVISVIVAGTVVVYVLVTPKAGDHYTAFYILDSNYDRSGYQKNLTLGENVTGIMGILNHEYQVIDYTLEIWLINQTITYNESTNENKTIFNHMWFVDKTTVTLPHIDIDVEKPNVTQWESDYSFPIIRNGTFKLTFFLFTAPTDEYAPDVDYKSIAAQKINDAYRELHLWIDVQ
jgi:uncharacterized membrane protein